VMYGRVGAQSGPVQTESGGVGRAMVKSQLQHCEKRGEECRPSSTLERAGKYTPLIAQAALKYHVDPRLLWTIAYLETRFQPESVSAKGARGMMQFMPSTAARYGLLTLQKMHDPNASIDAAARHLRDLMSRFDNRVALILAAYNAGEAAVVAYRSGQKLSLPGGLIINPRLIRTNGVPPYSETLGYVARGQVILRELTSAGIFPPAFVARCQPGTHRAETSSPGSNASPETHSFYVIDKSMREERPTATEILIESGNSTTGLPSAPEKFPRDGFPADTPPFEKPEITTAP
jgi:hypothetical protein